jgi:hypothetical protein
MIIVTAGTAEYADIIRAQVKRCSDFGFKHVVYDLGDLGFGTPHFVRHGDLTPTIGTDTLPPATFKASLMLDTMTRFAALNELVVWMDADCLPIHDFTIPKSHGEFDVAVTLRPVSEIGASGNYALDYLNSGVVFARKNAAGEAFLRVWSTQSVEFNSDQAALNKCVAFDFTTEDWRRAMGLHVIRPVWPSWNVLILDALEYNCWHLPPRPQTRILHFKRGIRSSAVNYL